MNPLSAYADSTDGDVEWLGAIPAHWKTVRLRFLARIDTGSMDSDQAEPEGVYPFYVRSNEVLISEIFTHDTEAILTAGDGEIGEIFHHVNGKFAVHQRVYLLHDFRGVNARFLFWFFSSQFRNVVAYGGALTTVASLRRPMLTSFPVLIPPLPEQAAIATYLDRETAEINAFIQDQEELIGLLQERRAATISHAVTKGVNGDEKMGESGVPWLGSVPVSWKVLSGRRLFSQRKEAARPDDVQLAATQEFGVIEQDRYTELTGNRVTVVLKGFDILKHVEPGDFVISMRSFQGGLEYSADAGKISSAYVMLRPSQRVDADYFRYLFKSESFISALRSTSNLVRDGQAMRFSNFSQVLIPVPPLNVQSTIARYLRVCPFSCVTGVRLS